MNNLTFNETLTVVLILVLVEDGLRALSKRNGEPHHVLILVLVEDGLREMLKDVVEIRVRYCLNPCSCGRWSQRFASIAISAQTNCLNPCSCGRWSQSRISINDKTSKIVVLILVLVEDGLRGYSRN